VPLNKSYILNNCTNAIIYDFTPAYLKPPLQIRVPRLHKAMSPNVTGDTVEMYCYKIHGYEISKHGFNAKKINHVGFSILIL
jgi:hypothetical protein